MDQRYFPFMSMEEVYKVDDRGLTYNRILQAFGAFKIPPAAISSDFKALITQVLRDEFPALRCSVARAIIEGRIPGVPVPAAHIHVGWKLRIKQMLYLLDIFETIAYRYLENQIKEQSTPVRNQIRGIAKTLGTTKIPGLMEAVFDLKPEDVPVKKRKKKTNARAS